jgi:AbrB family looped-hinge helix DNA binding protein
MDASTVTSEGQVTIAKEVRRALGIRQGSRVAFATKNGKVELRVLHRAPETVVSGHGMLDARFKQLPPDSDAASLLAPKRGAKR